MRNQFRHEQITSRKYLLLHIIRSLPSQRNLGNIILDYLKTGFIALEIHQNRLKLVMPNLTMQIRRPVKNLLRYIALLREFFVDLAFFLSFWEGDVNNIMDFFTMSSFYCPGAVIAHFLYYVKGLLSLEGFFRFWFVRQKPPVLGLLSESG